MLSKLNIDDSYESKRQLAVKYFSECDNDKSGVVSIQEFLQWGDTEVFK